MCSADVGAGSSREIFNYFLNYWDDEWKFERNWKFSGDAEWLLLKSPIWNVHWNCKCIEWGEVHYTLKNKAKMEIKCCLKISTKMWNWGFIMWWISSHVSTCNVCITMKISQEKSSNEIDFKIRKSFWDIFVTKLCLKNSFEIVAIILCNFGNKKKRLN